jgi:hypothetical protein
MTEKDAHLRQLHDDIVDYSQTVIALLAFAALITHERESVRENAEFGIGRRMTTSSMNMVKQKSDVHPDLVAQKSFSYGIVAETKKSLHRERLQWARHLERLRKYDDQLIGWWTPTEGINHSDTIMLIHQSRGRQFTDFLKEEKDRDPSTVGPTTCVVEFIHSVETEDYFFLRLEHGTIQDKELSKQLSEGTPVPLDDIMRSFPNIRYYDAPPPIVLLLEHLWTDYFPAMRSNATYDEKNKVWKIMASVSRTTEEFKKAYGSGALQKDARSVEFPTTKWIREAFDRLVKYKMAFPPSDGSDNYIIFFKPFRIDVRRRFLTLEIGKSARRAPRDSKQLRLVPLQEDQEE